MCSFFDICQVNSNLLDFSSVYCSDLATVHNSLNNRQTTLSNWPSSLPVAHYSGKPEWEVGISPSTLREVKRSIASLKRRKTKRSNRITLGSFQNDGPVSALKLTEILTKIWGLEVILSDWSRSLILPVYMERQKFSCDNHKVWLI